MKTPTHLTYCMNVHPGETWARTFRNIRSYATAVKAAVSPNRPFGLGLRLSAQTVGQLRARQMAYLKAYLAANDLYVFTINGFPYGRFHDGPVKTAVYRPDWRTTQRRDYTIRLAHILADLLPEGVSGSISTLPGSYNPWIRTDADVCRMVVRLMETVAELVRIRERTGREIHLGLEPEPDCWLETTADMVAFFEKTIPAYGGPQILASHLATTRRHVSALIRRHLGVCVDTCHMALQFEEPLTTLRTLVKHKIRISKVQLSAALSVRRSPASIERLREFCDDVYLHQTRVCDPRGVIRVMDDLPSALAQDADDPLRGEWRVHVHVPLHMKQFGVLKSTRTQLTPAFFRAARSATRHLEIETYTFHVLPANIRTRGVVRSIAAEFRWVAAQLGALCVAPFFVPLAWLTT